MPKKVHAPDDLFTLIKSLSKAEKRYFKIQANAENSSNKNYMILFDILCELEHYNEAEVKDMLKDKMQTANFHVTKKYLFDSIVKALASFHAEETIDIKVRQMAINIFVLNKKGLFEISRKKILELEKFAAKHQKLTVLNETYSLLKNNIIDTVHKNYTKADVESITLKERKTLELIANLKEYRTLLLKIFILHMELHAKGKEQIKREVFEVAKHPLLQDESLALSTDAKVLFHNINGYIHKEIGDFQKCKSHFKSYLKLLEHKPLLLKNQKVNYIVGLYNYAIILRELKQYDEMLLTLQKAKSIPSKSDVNELRQFRNYYQLILACYNDTGKYQLSLALEPEINAGFKKFGAKLDTVYIAHIKYYLAFAYYGDKQYNKAIKILNEINNEPHQEPLNDLLAYTRILLWICHYESNNIDVLDYLWNSMHRYIAKKFSEDAIENLFCEYTKKPETLKEGNYLKEFKKAIKDKKQSEFLDINWWLKERVAL